MFNGDEAFFGVVKAPIVRGGQDDKHVKGGHTFLVVYSEMFLQICRDYSSLPNPKELKAHEILFFYNGLRAELKQHTRR